MKHSKSKSLLSGATTIAILIASVIIFAPRNVFAYAMPDITANILSFTSTPSYPQKTIFVIGSWDSGLNDPCIDTGTFPNVTSGGMCNLSNGHLVGSGFADNQLGPTDLTNGSYALEENRLYVLNIFQGADASPQLGAYQAQYFFIYHSAGSVLTPNPILPDTSTHIVDFTPENGTTTQNPVLFSLHAYINPDDIGTFIGIKLSLHNIDQNVLLLSFLSPSDINFLDSFQATTSGDFYYASTTSIGEGNYRINATLTRSYLGGFFINPFAQVNEDLSHQFIVGTSTFIGSISQQSYSAMNSFFASSTATSTIALAGSCNPLSGVFSALNCLAFLFIPDSGLLYDTLNNFRFRVSTHFPLGYITDFLSIMSTTTASSMPLVDTNLPPVLGFGSPHIRLDFSHALDFVYNADVGVFDNASTTSQTFLEVTMGYWEIIVWLLTAFYIVGRIIGTHLVPDFFRTNQFGSKGSLSDTNSNDDSYRLKEYLYKNRKK